jgi:hypothetical protein
MANQRIEELSRRRTCMDVMMNWFKALFNKFWDQMLMLSLAMMICLSGVASFWLADEYRVNPAFIFLGWNSIALIPLFVKKFRTHLKRPSFIAFLIAWMVVHGLVMVVLTRWVPILYWAPFIFLDLLVGFLAANWLFGVMPNEGNVDQW